MIKNQALYDRLVARIRIDEKTGCWLWTGPGWFKRKWAQNRYGYITLWNTVTKKTTCVGTHRAMLIAIHGPLTSDQCACHRCDVPLCINPTHLFIGTMKDNIRDSRSKNRHHEAKKDYCDRGHPLFGDNLYLSKQSAAKGRAIRRSCKTCHKIRQRIKSGWPPDLAASIGNVPHGYKVDFETGQLIFQLKPRRRTDSAGESNGPD